MECWGKESCPCYASSAVSVFRTVLRFGASPTAIEDTIGYVVLPNLKLTFTMVRVKPSEIIVRFNSFYLVEH
eukprot:scaffold3632_cov162-Amphora_coffeaeformis.AAC.3